MSTRIETGKPAKPELLHYELAQAGLPVEGVSADGGVDIWREINEAETTTLWQIVNAHDPNGKTPGELDEEEAVASRAAFKSLPNWATWTPTQAKDYVNANVLQGWDKTQANAWLDANVTSLATAKEAMKQIAGAVIDLRTILAIVGGAVLMLRDQIIRRHSS